MTDAAEVTDLCDQREHADGVTWVCTEPLGHADGGWHYDPVEGRWWKRSATATLTRGVRTVPDPDHRPPRPANRKETSMSFAFGAIGTKEDVIHQLEAASITGGPDRFNEFGTDLRDLLVKHFGAETATAGNGYEYRYVVSANGHGGGNTALSLQLTVEPKWVPAVPASIAGDTASE